MKRPRPTVIDKLRAKAAPAAPPVVADFRDLRNLVVAARRALPVLAGAELSLVAQAIERVEAMLMRYAAAQAPAAAPSPAAPAAPPPEPAKG